VDVPAQTRAEILARAEEERVRGLLSRYLSPRVTEAVLEEAHAATRSVDAVDVSTLFCDLRGFTRVAESSPAVETARRLNEFLDEMTQAVFKYDGMLVQFTGDGLLAVFGAPFAMHDHAPRAVHAALEMQARHDALLVQWSESNWADLGLGIGIYSGTAFVGNFGSAQRVDYTVIGHVVNVASRLTAIAPAGHILVGESTLRLIEGGAEVEPMGEISLKHVSQPVPVFRLLGVRAEGAMYCLSCGSPLDGLSGTCQTCGAIFRGLESAENPADRLLTVARVASTLTSLGRRDSPHLIAVSGPHQGADFRVGFPCSIGREALTNQIVLSLDPSVSRRHALLRPDSDGVVIVDLGSQNGTYVNEQRVDLALMRDGDVVRIGRSRLVATEFDGRTKE
jgi:class 3 adenylate cyclase